uniref:Uncharacterized protein n=1 Tax=Caenorhabditis japonica TaxID=281687 RepID=A0A8R1HRC6_CAEJA
MVASRTATSASDRGLAAEPEPRVLCGLPIGGAVGILASIIMICQIFGLFYLSPFMLYFFEICIGSAMMFILSTGAKHRKIAYVTAYMLYISMYTFWVFFLILGAILAAVWLEDNQSNLCSQEAADYSSTHRGCIQSTFSTGDLEMVIISCVFLTISIIVAIVQMRYLMLLYNFLRRNAFRLPSHHQNFNVQYIVPTPISPSGMPPPPRYSAAPMPMNPTAGPITNKQPIGTESGVTPTPILGGTTPSERSTITEPTENEDPSRSRAPSGPPAYSDVAEPGHITVRTDSLS